MEKKTPSLRFISYGYKHGDRPKGAFGIDVRSLINPFWEPSLRELTGKDQEIKDYILKDARTAGILEEIQKRVEKAISDAKNEGKDHLDIYLVCTGGQHRSVFAAEWLYSLYKNEYQCEVHHRDLDKRNT